MESERRSHERIRLTQDQVKGAFFIVLNDEKIPFTEVFDISVSGTGVRIGHRIHDGDKVKIGCEIDDLIIVINGEVAWQQELKDGEFRVGIQFSNENMSDNVKLFSAMKDNLSFDQ